MSFKNFLNKVSGKYLYSNSFKNLCKCLDFSKENIEYIRNNVFDDEKLEEIILLIYNQIQKEDLSKDFEYDGSLRESINNYFYEVYIIDESKWDDIKNKLSCEIDIGKINSFYLLEKSFYNTLECDEIWIASSTILMKVINNLLGSHSFPETVEKFLIKDIINAFRHAPIYFDEIKDFFHESLSKYASTPLIKLSQYSFHDVLNSYFLVENKDLVTFFGNLLSFDEGFDDNKAKYLFVYKKHIDIEDYFLVLSTAYKEGDGFIFKDWDFSKNYFIHRDLIEDSLALLTNFSWEFREHFDDYIEQKFFEIKLNHDKISSNEYNSFNMVTYSNPNLENECIMLEPFVKKDRSYQFKQVNYDAGNLKEVILQNPLSKEFLEIISLLDLNLSFAGQLQSIIKNEDIDSILYCFNHKILDDLDYSKDIISKDVLKEYLIDYEIKTILLNCENSWDEIKNDLISKIDSKIILSTYDLSFEYGEHQLVKGSSLKWFKSNILQTEINILIKFREENKAKHGPKLAYYLRDLDIYSNDLYKYFDKNLNENYNPMPQSLSEAIDYLIINSSRDFMDYIYEMDKNETISLHFTLGMWIRNEFGINGWKNSGLLKDLNTGLWADNYSSEILDALWEYVQENYDDIIKNTEFTNTIDMYKYVTIM